MDGCIRAFINYFFIVLYQKNIVILVIIHPYFGLMTSFYRFFIRYVSYMIQKHHTIKRGFVPQEKFQTKLKKHSNKNK